MTKVLENMSFEELLQVNKKLFSENLNLESKVADLQFQVEQMNRLLYGAKRERLFISTEKYTSSSVQKYTILL
jgi:hypothetical protein